MKCFVYVAPCAWEDLLKVGHSRDPLGRLEAFHRRWYETFDPDLAWLVELDRVRDAAGLELSLRRGVAEHNAPAPLTIRREAAGQGEWFRGASEVLARADRLHGWTAAVLDADALEAPVDATPVSRAVRDTLDAYAAFGIDLAPMLPPDVVRWRGLAG